jgi:hypothetical protein
MAITEILLIISSKSVNLWKLGDLLKGERKLAIRL